MQRSRRVFRVILGVAFLAAVIVSYLLLILMMLQSTNRYEWMTAEGVKNLPIDEDSPKRVIMFAIMIMFSSVITLSLAVAKYGWTFIRKPLGWISLLPLFYAMFRGIGVMLR